jgi:large subunit ribosomal protein L36
MHHCKILADMKVKPSIKKRSVDCKIVRRKGKLYVINKKEPEVQTTSRINLVMS